MFNLLQSVQTKSLDIQMSIIENMCLILESCSVSKEGRKVLNSICEFILNCVEASKKQFGLGEAAQISVEMLRLKHMAQGLHLLEDSGSDIAVSKNFGEHVCRLECYTPDLQDTTVNELKKMKEKSHQNFRDIDIKIKVPVQQVQGFWVKCQNGHLNCKTFVPCVENMQCKYCDLDLNINDEKRPIFKETDTKALIKMDPDIKNPSTPRNNENKKQRYRNKNNNNKFQ